MNLYKIARWADTYESHETKKLHALRFVLIPNKTDGLGFRRIAAQQDAANLFAAWILMVEIASKGRKGERGVLARDGVPLDASDLAAMTGFPVAIFERALIFFVDAKMGWLEVAAIETTGEMLPGFPANLPASPGNIPLSPGNIPAPAENLAADRKGIEEKGKEGNISVAAIAVEIYEAYPRRQGKQDALKAIAKTIKAGIDSKHLLERTKAFATAAGKWNVEDRQFIPHPATWFNRGSFDDDPSTWVRVGKTDKSRSGFA